MAPLDPGARTPVRCVPEPPLWQFRELLIRRYRPADHSTVLALHRDGLARVGLRPGDGVYYEHDLFQMEDIYLANGGEFLVGLLSRRPGAQRPHESAEDGRSPLSWERPATIVAMGGLRRTGLARHGDARVGAAPGVSHVLVADSAEMVRLRVRPDLQRRGYGGALVLALEERAVELGYRALQCDTTEFQHAAVELYRRFGWRESGRRTIGGIVNVYFEKVLRE